MFVRLPVNNGQELSWCCSNAAKTLEASINITRGDGIGLLGPVLTLSHLSALLLVQYSLMNPQGSPSRSHIR